MADRRTPPANGYLLVESLIALAIVAIMSTLVFETISQMSHSVNLITDRRHGLMLARSVLAAATVKSAVPAITAKGTDGDLAWSITSETWHPDDAGAGAWDKVTVTIFNRSNNVVIARLSGLRPPQ